MTELGLGYACICTEYSDRLPKSTQLKVNNSCVAATFRKEGGREIAISKARTNLTNVLTYLKWNEERGIRFYRLSSDMFPHMTNPEFITGQPNPDSPEKVGEGESGEGASYAYPLDLFDEELKAIGRYAKEHGHRLTMHPGQFCQVGAIKDEVFVKTVRDLSLHADILDAMDLDLNSVMIVHGGGIYAEKSEKTVEAIKQAKMRTMERWVKQFFKMPEKVRRRLVIENCEHCYSVLDMLWISERINRPVVFDTHHHACYEQLVEPLGVEPKEFLPQVLETWNKLGIKPKFHISEQAESKKIGAHSDYVHVIPNYLLNILRSGQPVDLMIEAKAKEKAVMKLYQTYGKLINGTWFLIEPLDMSGLSLSLSF